MSWHAEQIYTKPNLELIKAFSQVESLKHRLFVVNSLEGIRSEWSRDIFFNPEGENRAKKHGLPPDGLLAVAPVIYPTGYDSKSERGSPFWQANDVDKQTWEDIPHKEHCKSLNGYSDLLFKNEGQANLLGWLEKLHEETKEPIMYFYNEMWAGDIEEEYAIVFDNGLHLYTYQFDSEQTVNQVTGETFKELPLQKGLQHLGLELPTYFFALHEGTFDWKRYQYHFDHSS